MTTAKKIREVVESPLLICRAEQLPNGRVGIYYEDASNAVYNGKLRILDAIVEEVEMIYLHLEASICNCGEPYNGSDAYDAASELLNQLKEAREELINNH